jgi:hypothetical protein
VVPELSLLFLQQPGSAKVAATASATHGKVHLEDISFAPPGRTEVDGG